MHDLRFAPDAKRQSAPLEYLEHRDVLRQDLSDQFLEPGFPSNRGEMMHERRTDTLSLILVYYGESHFGLSRLHDDVTGAARDHWRAVFVNYCDQCDVIDEIDAQEIVDFSLCEATFYRKETTVKGLRAAETAAMRSARSSGLSARISTRRPSRSVSNAE